MGNLSKFFRLNAMLAGLIRLQKRFWWGALIISIGLIGVGFYLSKGIGINTDLKSLLPHDSSLVKNMDYISPKAGGGNDIRVVLKGGGIEEKVKAAEALSEYLYAQPGLVRAVRFITPKTFLEEKKYQLIPYSDLEKIHDKVEQERRKNADVTDPFGLERIQEQEEQKDVENTSAIQQQEVDLEDAKAFLQVIDDLPEYYTTSNQEYLIVRILPQQEGLNIQRNKETFESFKKIIAGFDFSQFHSEMSFDLYGSIYDQIERYNSILGDVSRGGIGVVFILIILLIYFRSLWSLVVLLPPLLVGMTMGTGLATVLESKFNLIAIFLVLVVFGVGIEFGIHLWARYLQERKSKGLFESLEATWKTTGRATITSAIALLAGFALLVFSNFQGFAQFGRVALVMLSMTALSFLVFTPAWIILVEKLRRGRAWPRSLSDVLIEKSQSWTLSLNFMRNLRWASLFFLVIGVPLVLLEFRFDYSFKESQARSNESQVRKASRSNFGNTVLKPSAVALFQSEEEAFRFVDGFQQVKSEYPDIRRITGLASFLPIDQQERIEKLQFISDDLEYSWIDRIEDEQVKKALLEIKDTAYDLEEYAYEDLPAVLIEQFMASDGLGEYVVFLYDIGGETDGRKAMRFSSAVQEWIARSGVDPIVSGQELIFAEVISKVVSEGPWLVVGMFILVFLICWLDFQKLSYSLVTLSPVVFGFLLTTVLLVLLGIDLNFFNMVAISSLGAMVVDNSVHLFHRYLHQKTVDSKRRVELAVFSVAPAVIACTLTSMSGYFGMAIATHNGIASLGQVAIVGLGCCLLSAVLFFPAWLKKIDSYKK